jgi:hypothetical protein
MRLSDHPAQASAGRDDVKILKNIQGRRRKSSICHLAMPVAISMARLVQYLSRCHDCARFPAAGARTQRAPFNVDRLGYSRLGVERYNLHR